MSTYWSHHVGNGIIDCAFSATEKLLVLGDVNGKIQVITYDKVIKYEYKFDMPVWGVSISKDGSIVSASLAQKHPTSAGRIVVINIELEKILFNKKINCEAWDTIIFDDHNKIFFSTWSEGLHSYNVKKKKHSVIPINESVFGLERFYDSLLLNISRAGVGKLDVNKMEEFNLITKNPYACYNLIFHEESDKILSGSSTNMLLVSSLENEINEQKIYKVLLSEVCAVECIFDFLLLGDLKGNFIVSSLNYPDIPLSAIKFNGGIWNIKYDKLNKLMFIACGDGNAYAYKINNNSDLEFSNGKFSKDADIKLLADTKIFISYSRRDREKANLLYNGLLSLGLKPWMDIYNLLPGQNWKYEIDVAMKESEFVLLCLSKNSLNNRGYIHREMRDTLDEVYNLPQGSVYMIPVRLDDCEIPHNLSEWHWVDMDTKDGFEKIISAIYYQKRKNLINGTK